MKTINFYQIRAISNLHVGSGEGDFSIVDKQVQRDPVTGLPTIHASGIKGALREAMVQHAKSDETWNNPIIEVFGSDPKKREKKIRQGLNHFFDGKLLVLPIRSSHDFFYRATCPLVLNELIGMLEQFAPEHPLIEPLKNLANIVVEPSKPKYFGNDTKEITLEDWKATFHNLDTSAIQSLTGDRLALLHNDDFLGLAKELPIIARNYLNDGISDNLWYEEVVPRESLFYTMISRHSDNDKLNEFLSLKKHVVQLGANATVGYGLCNFKTF